MKTISLHQVLPQVFSEREDLSSDVWNTEVDFTKGFTYLVEAESGMGKVRSAVICLVTVMIIPDSYSSTKTMSVIIRYHSG